MLRVPAVSSRALASKLTGTNLRLHVSLLWYVLLSAFHWQYNKSLTIFFLFAYHSFVHCEAPSPDTLLVLPLPQQS